MRIWICVISLLCIWEVQAAPKIAVTDLAYETRVQQYVQSTTAGNRFQSGPYHANGSASYQTYESRNSYIQQNELRNFSGDIKGKILKSGLFRLVQATPYKASDKTDVYDVIKRIKAGHFKGADYVLFGTVSDIDFTRDLNALANTRSYSAILGLTLVADFSLINTRTLEVTSAFTAMGKGEDIKLTNRHDLRVSLNRPQVIRDVAATLGEDVVRQLQEQLTGIAPQPPKSAPAPLNRLPEDEAAVILR